MSIAESTPVRGPWLGGASVRFNEALAVKGTMLFGSMWTFYLFTAYGLLGAFPCFAGYKDALLYWSNWIQLWALPLLMVGGIVLNRATERRAEQDHEVILKEFDLIKTAAASIAEELEIGRGSRDAILKQVDLLQSTAAEMAEELDIAREGRTQLHDLARLLPDVVARLARLEAKLGTG
jgi:hypothetical protein